VLCVVSNINPCSYPNLIVKLGLIFGSVDILVVVEFSDDCKFIISKEIFKGLLEFIFVYVGFVDVGIVIIPVFKFS